MTSIAANPPTRAAASARPAWYRQLYIQVLAAIAAGVLMGIVVPDLAERMQPLGDAFIRAIRMLIAPIIFCTIVHGIAGAQSLRSAGRVALKSIIYFEAVTTLALLVGLVVVNVLQPGAGMNVDPATLDTRAIAAYEQPADQTGVVAFLMQIIPVSVVGAFAEGHVLQVLFFSVIFAVALFQLGEAGRPVLTVIDSLLQVLFRVVGLVMKVAPIGAFGAMAFTIGRYGLASLLPLAKLMASFYLTCGLFLVLVLGVVARLAGFSLWRLLRYIREEILIVIGTSSSESVLPRIIQKLEALGCEKSVTGLVIPTGYSFNLDGTCIYLVMVTVFLAQATNIDLTVAQQAGIIGVLLVASKGAAGVAGAALVVLAATLHSIGTIPVASLSLVLGVHRFMGEAISVTNLIGNAVATVVVSKWENSLDSECMARQLEAPRAPQI